MKKEDKILKEAYVYKIISKNSPNVYVGSTSEKLNIRLSKHKSDYKRFLIGVNKNPVSSFIVLSKFDYDIVLIETYYNISKLELKHKERYFIQTTPHCINKNHPGLTRKETNRKYYLKCKEKLYLRTCTCPSEPIAASS